MANAVNHWVDPNNCMEFEMVAQKGPSRLDLGMALLNHAESETRVPSEPIRLLFLTRQYPLRTPAMQIKWFVRLARLDHEDGSDDSWNFRGYATRSAKWNYGGVNAELKVEGYYNSRTRTGHLCVEQHSATQQ